MQGTVHTVIRMTQFFACPIWPTVPTKTAFLVTQNGAFWYRSSETEEKIENAAGSIVGIVDGNKTEFGAGVVWSVFNSV